MRTIKVKDLVKALSGYDDFDIEAVLCEINDEEVGYKAIQYRKFNIDISDIGYSSKIINLDLEEI